MHPATHLVLHVDGVQDAGHLVGVLHVQDGLSRQHQAQEVITGAWC